MLLTKQRKVTKKLVYTRYTKKYRKWLERLGVSVSEEELKKGIEDDGADGYEVGVYWTKTWLSYDCDCCL